MVSYKYPIPILPWRHVLVTRNPKTKPCGNFPKQVLHYSKNNEDDKSFTCVLRIVPLAD